MEPEYLKDIVGDIAVVTTILQFLSGALVCKQYIKNRTTGESSPLPFISCVLSCCLWLYYGLAKREGKIIFVNIVGITLMTGYSTIFYIITFKKSLVKKQVLAASVLLSFVIFFGAMQKDYNELINFLGILASIFTLVTISAPMSKLFYVIKVKNTECLPFPLILMSFLVSSLWTLYGYFIKDAFLECVNVVGASLALAQLCLFLVYPSSPSSSPLLPKNIAETF